MAHGDFRILDVDSCMEDYYHKEAGADPAVVMETVAAREAEVNSMVGRGDYQNALSAALANPPVETDDIDCKERSAAAVVRVLAGIRDSEIEQAVGSLGPEDVDLLMKYVYRGMSLCEESGKLLKWHAALLKAGGIGSIVRAFADRQTV